MLEAELERRQRSSEPARSGARPQRLRQRLAVAASLAAHVLVVAALTRTPPGQDADEDRPRRAVVWVTDWRARAHALPATQPVVTAVPPSDPVASPDSAERAKADAPAVRAAEPPPPRARVERPARAVPPPIAQRSDPAPTEPTPLPLEPSQAPGAAEAERSSPRRVDWAEERRRAFASTVEQNRREQGFSTFTPSDLRGAPPEREPAPTGAIFDTPTPRTSSRGARPGQQHSRIGRWLASTCHAVTGGFGVKMLGFGSAAFCASGEPGVNVLGDLRQDYWKTVPDCTSEPPAAPLFVAADAIPFTMAKCRLVPKHE